VAFQDALLRFVQDTGPYALPALFTTSALEALFPPFPGDSITLLGAFYAVHGQLPLGLVFGAVTLGGVCGSAIGYAIGVRLGRAAERRAPGGGGLLSLDRVHRFEAAYRRHGDLYILVNRFLPGVRGFFFLAAGMSAMPFARTMVLGAVSAALWNALLLGAGFAVGENLDALVSAVRTYATAAWIALGVVAIALLVRALQRRRRP
jgi:membrane protein DedA with SNARE-associated domain